MRVWLPLVLLLGCGAKRLPPQEARLGERFVVEVPMRDGVRLHTKVLLPKGEGPFPTLLSRAPYAMGPVLDARCARFNRRGYACVWQSVRGRGKSGGDWVPFEREPQDGQDTLAWLVEQPWVDGNVGLLGESYLGAVQWAVADALPPEVKTLVPSVMGTDLYAAAYEGGLLRHEIATAWMSLMPERDFRVWKGSRGYQRALRHRPRTELDVVATGRELPWFREWLAADRSDAPFWSRPLAQRGYEAPANTRVPVLLIGGWSDAFLGPQIHTWNQLATQDRSTLVIGPWEHLGRVFAAVPQGRLDDDVGLGRSTLQWARLFDWFDHHLKGEPLRGHAGKVVTWPVNGSGWIVRDAWPPPTEPRVLELALGHDPQRCTGQAGVGVGSEGVVRWTWDPEDPTPSVGGAGLLAGSLPLWKGVTPGFVDQKRLCERRDDLVGFRTAPLTEPLHVAGTFTASLRFASDAEDTAVNVRILEERPSGARIHVRESIVRLSLRDGPDTPPYTPGEVVTVPLETWPIEYVFEAGSRVLVQVASASFPKYEAHPNVPGPPAEAVETRPARQRLILEGSTVTLPVVREAP